MRGVYTAATVQSDGGSSLDAAAGDFDFIELLPGGSQKLGAVELVSLSIGRYNSPPLGESSDHIISWEIRRFSGATLTSGNGTSATPRPQDPQDSATLGVLVERKADTVATTTGTSVLLHADVFALRLGLYRFWPPDMRLKFSDESAHEAMIIRTSGSPINTPHNITCYFAMVF